MTLPNKFRYYHSDSPSNKDWSGLAIRNDATGSVNIALDNGDTFTWSLREAERFVDQGFWVIVPDETITLTPVSEVTSKGPFATKLHFYYIGKPQNQFTAVEEDNGSGFKVDWGVVDPCYYTTDQVKGFIASGNWVVVGVE